MTKTAGTFGIKTEFLHWLTLQSFWAMGLTRFLALPAWWLAIQALFVPVLVVALSLRWSPVAYLSILLLLWLVFRSNTRERVPLYLSDTDTCNALLDLLPQGSLHFLDLGSGLGDTLSFLAPRRPDARFTGIESAPLPFLVSRLRLLGCPNAEVRCGNLWHENLARYDVVYAFLSPEPMPALWAKVSREMRPGTLFVSNSFEIPGVVPTRSFKPGNARQTQLLIFVIGEARGDES